MTIQELADHLRALIEGGLAPSTPVYVLGRGEPLAWPYPKAHLVGADGVTAETTGQFSCRFAKAGGPPARTRLVTLAERELGPGALRGGQSAAHDWQVAQWLVGHSYQLGVRTVTVRGQRWRPDDFGWQRDDTAGESPAYVLEPR